MLCVKTSFFVSMLGCVGDISNTGSCTYEQTLEKDNYTTMATELHISLDCLDRLLLVHVACRAMVELLPPYTYRRGHDVRTDEISWFAQGDKSFQVDRTRTMATEGAMSQ